MGTFLLHNGLRFDSYGEYRKHFESCEICKPMFDGEKTKAKDLIERAANVSFFEKFKSNQVDQKA